LPPSDQSGPKGSGVFTGLLAVLEGLVSPGLPPNMSALTQDACQHVWFYA
jgi:hypothetical protein